MYKVVVLVAEPREQKVIMFEKKPTFQDLYPLLECTIKPERGTGGHEPLAR
jgi:hypothetical protein